MSTKKGQWFSKYYVVIIILCLVAGLFIWFLFQDILTDMEEKSYNPIHQK